MPETRFLVFTLPPSKQTVGENVESPALATDRREINPEDTVADIMKVVRKLHNARDVELYRFSPQLTADGPLPRKSGKVTSRELLQLTGAHNYDLSKFCDYLDEDELTWSQVCERAGAPNPDIIAICVTLNAEAVAPGGSEEEEEVGSLPSRYFRTTREGPTPSQGASSLYAKHQGSTGKRKGVYDGRITVNGPPRVAAPVELYHPVFAEFKHHLNISHDDIPWDIIVSTTKLVELLSTIRSHENLRDSPELAKHLSKLLHTNSPSVVNSDLTVPDGMGLSPTPFAVQAIHLLREVKAEMGKGGSDAGVQVSLSYGRSWALVDRQPVNEYCCCPSFLLAIGGSYVGVLGAVITTNSVVQRLTPYTWAAHSHTFDEPEILELAHVFYALRLSLVSLATYYNTLSKPSPPPNFIHPRFVPHFTSYRVGDTEHQFTYVRPLLENSMVSLVYEVETTTSNGAKKRLVVKFVNRYCAELHRLLADCQMAPPLISHAPLGPGYKNMSMVVMDLVPGMSLWDRYGDGPLPEVVKTGVKDILHVIERKGFVYGDLRRPNVMVFNANSATTREDSLTVQFIDFDWAGKMGSGIRYPAHLSDIVKVTSGAEDMIEITREHMWSMFSNL
ncbi:hypothetical protein BDV98DRAFT_598969 [Pterulicium gracile]|uniref:Uncharacterized protein n=1 Tax=Pterulicium gracile TaxID=1884261 RepID=A0A5C3Q207_9AGAR|nr:hypothetical protein BDV98DRAFT_598969 [Pterula gracilis]